jgi:hypothetical protein
VIAAFAEKLAPGQGSRSRRRATLGVRLCAVAVLGLAGCVTPGAQPIVGPDGSPMLHVHCGSRQSECFRLAGESCPYGYDFAPVYAADDGNFFVRCRPAHIAAVPPPAPAPPVPVPAATAIASPQPTPAPSVVPPATQWPPAEVGNATEPWGKGSTATVNGGVPTSTLPPTPRTQLGEVDVGY